MPAWHISAAGSNCGLSLCTIPRSPTLASRPSSNSCLIARSRNKAMPGRIQQRMNEKPATLFDPYHKWLGIPAAEQPPHHYRMLGISLFESDQDVIEAAADRQMSHVQRYKTGQHSLLSQQLLNELAAAKVCLLRPEKKAAYDRQLRARLAAQSQSDAPEPIDLEALAHVIPLTNAVPAQPY